LGREVEDIESTNDAWSGEKYCGNGYGSRSDEKRKKRIAKQEKKRRETLPCYNMPAFVINLEGKRLIYKKNNGKTSKLVGHCSTCAQLHEIDLKSARSECDFYNCSQCKVVVPENHTIHKCSYCDAVITDKQRDISVGYPLFDQETDDDAKNVIVRKKYCGYHLPKKGHQKRNDYAGAGASTVSNLSKNRMSKPKKRIVYDTEYRPTLFVNDHEKHLSDNFVHRMLYKK
jgi:hypothetical protein